jgi:hypothetical protein
MNFFPSMILLTLPLYYVLIKDVGKKKVQGEGKT